MAETEKPKSKARPIVRLGIFLISHSIFFSVICFSAGVLALLLLPMFAMNTYISENALMPGSANTMLSGQEVSEANDLVKDMKGLNSKSGSTIFGSQQILAQYISNLGAEVNYHRFQPQSSQFHPLHFFSSPDSGIVQDNVSCMSQGINTVGIIRAPQADGKEAIVLVTPYNPVKTSLHETLSLGIAYSIFSLLTQVTWLAKDIVWLAADSRYGEYAAVSAWLRDYHTPSFGRSSMIDTYTCAETNVLYEFEANHVTEKESLDDFKRAGTMAAALVIKVSNRSEHFEDSLSVYAEASNGQMPNLDLINIVNYLAEHRQGFRIKIEKFWPLLDCKWLKFLGEFFESIGKFIRSLNPEWKFGMLASDYVDGTATLASSLYYQAVGIPTGPHGAFRDYQIDAITVEMSPKFSSGVKVRRDEFILRGGRLIEGVVRSVNNLLEKFHQSFFLYLMVSTSKFVSVGVYMIAFALLVAPLPAVAASLYSYANNLNLTLEKIEPAAPANPDDVLIVSLRSWKWLNAAKRVFVVHLWGAVVSLLPYFICQIPGYSPTTNSIIWALLSLLTLLILSVILGSPLSSTKSCEQRIQEWAFLKAMTTSAAFIGLCLMSVINFATAELGAFLVVSMCLLAHPLKLDLVAGNFKALSRAASNLVLGFIAFPPVTFFLFKAALQGFDNLHLGDFWNWMETLWAWNSATFLYLGMVHLPCWVLCTQILLHPC
ncbi:glycosylphosphatidylinositol anchor attachment 1 protein-like isoform X1 [Cucurbita pepo subsp. pepo]|uniref:glycosylphosphatidylinositol anchor attachment 1 protein-like isoform X1 n=3 Tax=Cucurbita pepo subsp. pepo TaxID=3664 RepID=UPI000C9D2AB3|nr:glycosylphosphatidylinositol anchor attachment 1 protein-like isoform X1 [Cucurbita pepo subsp. pepo]